MSFFGNMGSVDATAAGNRRPYFLEGTYKVRVVKAAAFNSRTGIPYFVAEAEILESNNPDRPAGMVCAQVIKLATDMGPINVKRFIAAANGIDPNSQAANEEVNEDVCEYAVSDEQPLAGIEMGLQCVLTATQKGGDYTIHHWEPALG